MNNKKIEKLKEAIKVLQEQLEEAEKTSFEPCYKGFSILLDDKSIHSNQLITTYKVAKKARIFETEEIARKVDDIISPSYFIAQYVFKHCPDFKTDFNSQQDHYCLSANNEKYTIEYNTCKVFGVVYMPRNIAEDLCKLLNNGYYQLAAKND